MDTGQRPGLTRCPRWALCGSWLRRSAASPVCGGAGAEAGATASAALRLASVCTALPGVGQPLSTCWRAPRCAALLGSGQSVQPGRCRAVPPASAASAGGSTFLSLGLHVSKVFPGGFLPLRDLRVSQGLSSSQGHAQSPRVDGPRTAGGRCPGTVSVAGPPPWLGGRVSGRCWAIAGPPARPSSLGPMLTFCRQLLSQVPVFFPSEGLLGFGAPPRSQERGGGVSAALSPAVTIPGGWPVA